MLPLLTDRGILIVISFGGFLSKSNRPSNTSRIVYICKTTSNVCCWY